jgi:tRNA U34 5-carboxymethylaminomethyl modifying GTPase MnmE/TrmE
MVLQLLDQSDLDVCNFLVKLSGMLCAGEDVVELHTHGVPVVVRAVLQGICSVEGVRLANPGEFSLRAFQVSGNAVLSSPVP